MSKKSDLLDDARKEFQRARDAIDDISTTKFTDLDSLFDAMAKDCDDGMKLLDELEKCIDETGE